MALNSTTLQNYGFTNGANTTFITTAVDPATNYCISAKRTDKPAKIFHISGGDGVADGDCPTTP